MSLVSGSEQSTNNVVPGLNLSISIQWPAIITHPDDGWHSPASLETPSPSTGAFNSNTLFLQSLSSAVTRHSPWVTIKHWWQVLCA